MPGEGSGKEIKLPGPISLELKPKRVRITRMQWWTTDAAVESFFEGCGAIKRVTVSLSV